MILEATDGKALSLAGFFFFFMLNAQRFYSLKKIWKCHGNI